MILVTAPTSNIGRQVIDNLLAAGRSVRVIARDPEKLGSRRERVDALTGSHSDADLVARASEGVEAVFWLVPPAPQAAGVEDAYVGFSAAPIAAIAEQGAPRVVGISALGRGTKQAGHAGLVTGSLALDDMIVASGLPYRALANPSFFDNLLRQVATIREQGIFFSAVDPARPLPACATADIAGAAAGLLMDGSWRGTGEVAVLGPEDISFDGMAAIMTQVLGKPVRCQRIEYEAHKARFLGLGMSEAMAQGMVDMARAKSEGLDNGVKRTARNSTPTGFRAWCAAVLKPAVLG